MEQLKNVDPSTWSEMTKQHITGFLGMATQEIMESQSKPAGAIYEAFEIAMQWLAASG